MTPLHLKMLLHYYISPSPYAKHEPEHAASIAVRDYRNQLQSFGLIEATAESDSGFRVTTRGQAYIKMLCELPLPVCKWVQP